MRLEYIARFLDTEYLTLKEFVKTNFKDIVYYRQLNIDIDKAKEIAKEFIKQNYPDIYNENNIDDSIYTLLERRKYTTRDIACIWDLNPTIVKNTADMFFYNENFNIQDNAKRRKKNYYTYNQAISIVENILSRRLVNSSDLKPKLWW